MTEPPLARLGAPAAPDRHKLSFYPETRFGGFSDHDGTVAFYTRVNALLRPSSTVVDFGCGRGEHAEDTVEYRRNLRCFRGKVAKVIGLDVDEAGHGNPTLDEFVRIAPGEAWRLADRSVDMIVSDAVLEHLPEPHLFFREARRVLAESSFLCLRTTNLWGYVGMASKLVPNRLHAPVLGRVQGIREERDIFPTLYRCNTLGAVRRALQASGFRAVVYGHTAEPNYLNFSKLAYALGVLHQRIVPGTFGLTIFAFGQAIEPADGGQS